MRSTLRLLHACRITLFTRANCSLCTDAKLVLSNVWDKRPFDFQEIDVMAVGSEKWKIYEFDTPVIHVDKVDQKAPDLEISTSSRKLMHRFKTEQVEQLMDDVEKASS